MTEQKTKSERAFAYLHENQHRFMPMVELLAHVYGDDAVSNNIGRNLIYRTNKRLKKNARNGASSR